METRQFYFQLVGLIIINGLYAIVPAAIIAAIYWGFEKSQAHRPSYVRLFRNSFIFFCAWRSSI